MDELTQEELDALPVLQVDPNKKLYGSGSGLSDGSEPYSDRYEYVIRGLNGAYSEPEGADTEAESAGKILAALTGEGFPTALTLSPRPSGESALACEWLAPVTVSEPTLPAHVDGRSPPGRHSRSSTHLVSCRWPLSEGTMYGVKRDLAFPPDPPSVSWSWSASASPGAYTLAACRETSAEVHRSEYASCGPRPYHVASVRSRCTL